MSRRSGNPAKRGWDPITIGLANPQSPMAAVHFDSDGHRSHYRYRTRQRSVKVQAFGNRLYDGLALTFADGSMHLSFKRRDRAAAHDWRHFQAIKNEVAGPDREAIEIYPPEANLHDAANEYHLWVLPPDCKSSLGFAGQGQLGAEYEEFDYAAYREGTGPPNGRQRGWERGLPTGPRPGTGTGTGGRS